MPSGSNDDERLPDPMLVGIDDDYTPPENADDYVSAQTTNVDRDGPMGRITIDMLEINELDQMLNDLRARRLVNVERARELETAKQYADSVSDLAKFERLVARVHKSLDKMAGDEQRLADDLNKLRIMAIALGG